jgi:tetratricopeptide (TPR) repeat protein
MQTSLTRHLFARAGAVLVALALAGAAAPALAAGGGGGGGGGAGGSTPQCSAGYAYDATKQKCVKTSMLDDQQLLEQGRRLALAGSYDSALDTLSYVRNKHDDMVLTYIGYSKRKLGKVDEGIDYYHQALAINPNNLNTREYLGEGYVAAGRTDLAVDQLNKLEALCGTDCDQYEQLELAIAGTPEHWQ